MCALQILPEKEYITWRVTGAIVHKESDLAVLLAGSSDSSTELWIPSWKISKGPPRKGEWVGAFGNVNGKCQIVSRSSNGGGIIEVDNDGQANFGIVTKVYEEYRDQVLLPCPCFEIGASFGSGMSGGPVFDERGEICGVVSSSVEGAGTSYAVTIGPSLRQIYDVTSGTSLVSV